MRGFNLVFLVGTILFVAATLYFSISFAVRRLRRLETLLGRIAPTVDGRVRPAHWLSGRPALIFRLCGLPALLEFTSTGGKHPVYYTDLMVELSGKAPFPLRLAPEGFFQKVGKLLGMQDIEMGDALFDAAFSVQSSDEGRLMRFLSPRVRQLLFAMRSLSAPEQLWVEVDGGTLRIRKLGWLETEPHLRQYLDQSLEIAEAYLDVL